MRDPDTHIGGTRRSFPETTWGIVSRVRDRQGFESLCLRYWKPVHQFVRAAWAKTNEDAKDLTQAFFLWLMEGNALGKYEPERGGFRSYLKSLLRHFVAHQEEARRRLKRGGGVLVLPLHEAGDPAAGADPEKALDGAWAKEVVRRATDRVRERCASGERALQWRAFEEYDLAPAGEKRTYAQVAVRLGLRESDVRNYLFAMRERVRAEIRAELADTVASERELKQEWDALFGR